MPTTSVVPPSSVECAPVSFSLSLSLAPWIVVCSCISVAVDVLQVIRFYFVSPRCPITWKESSPSAIFAVAASSSSFVRKKNPDTMKRHLSDSEPEINEDYDECSR